ncbi:FAD-dependent oxidoreductase [Variovorax paradoxus]|uniref:FAD-dependent oxidoreductase n=1 Tax=Variovorax paradoxus TaxID=34073 RepID=UPI001560E9C8|nr:FAD-dependent oxidoreductase [Variovorax paradoxus]
MNPQTVASVALATDYDLVVLGAGAAGMTAALVGALEGLRVLLVEKTAQVGGTSSRSAGTLWIPGNFSMTQDAACDDVTEARTYLDALVGERSPAYLRDAFLRHGPEMLRFLLARTEIRFKPCPKHADYHPELPGSRPGGRPVEPELFDGRRLGEAFDLLRPTIPEFTVFGGMMVSKADIDLLLKAGRQWAGSVHAARVGGRYLRDRLSHRRGTRLTMGNALCGSLLEACLTHGVDLRVATEVTGIEALANHRYRLSLASAGGQRKFVEAKHGVIFAGGGFSGNAQARARHLPQPTPEYTAAFEGDDASSQALAQSLGATLATPREHNAWWFPCSIVPRADGSQGVFPHIIMDRAKPGLIAVRRDGKRFVNEGVSYHAFSRAQYASDAVPCWLVCDATFLRRYGLGAIRPGGWGLHRAIKSGYVRTARTLEALAGLVGVDAAGLVDSAQRMTRFARTGVDTDFGKGGDPLSRQNGDSTQRPNPCLGAIETAPFYALQVAPADLGTSLGLKTDACARLIDELGDPIPGLYACGNDMQSIMGGQYPAPGVTLGPAMTFAYVAARDAAANC